MALLVAGLAFFLIVHSVGIAAPDWRAHQLQRLGEGPWKLAYSVASVVGLVLIVWGYGHARADPVLLYAPPAWTRHAAALLTVIAFVLVAAAYVPGTRLKAAIGHPMTAGVALWAFAHLLANGRLHAVTLFGAFLLWALITLIIRRRRDRQTAKVYPPGRLSRDAIAGVAGVAAAVGFALFLHGPWIGVRPFG